jgi:hypothetical protein
MLAMCPRKLKMLLSKRQSLVILKASVLIFAFSIYFIVLIRESMNVMENAKSKTVTPKVDNVSIVKNNEIENCVPQLTFSPPAPPTVRAR